MQLTEASLVNGVILPPRGHSASLRPLRHQKVTQGNLGNLNPFDLYLSTVVFIFLIFLP